MPGMGTEGLGRRGPPLATRLRKSRPGAVCGPRDRAAEPGHLRPHISFARLRWGSGTQSMNFAAACETGCEMIMWRDESASGSQTGGSQSYPCCGDLLAQVTAGQAGRVLQGGRRESVGGAPRGRRTRLSAVGLSGLSRSSRLAFRQSGSCCNAFVTSKSRIL